MPAISLTPLVTLTVVSTINSQPDGSNTLSLADNTVISCQPDGSIQYRPAGTNGPYEKCILSGNLATFSPDGIHVYQFAYAASIPN